MSEALTYSNLSNGTDAENATWHSHCIFSIPHLARLAVATPLAKIFHLTGNFSMSQPRFEPFRKTKLCKLLMVILPYSGNVCHWQLFLGGFKYS